MEQRKAGVLYWVVASLLVLVWVSPILASLLTSVKSLSEINQGRYWTLPEKFAWENYVEAFTSGGFSGYITNSFLITIPAVLGSLMLSAVNGYVLGKLRFAARGNLLLMFVAGMFLPFQILLIPVYYLSTTFGVYDTRLGLILFHVAFQLAFGSLFMSSFVKTLPDATIEAARIDGCSELRIFCSVVLPLLRPALASLATLLFTWIWNDYLWALVLLQSDELKPITAGLAKLKGQWVASYQLQSAGAVIAAIPPVLVFAFLQKHFIRGMTLGSGK